MPVTWKCEMCGKEKTTKPSRVGKFCGKECTAEYNRQRLDTGTYKACEVCGEQFKTKPSHLNKRRTCSNECSGQLKVIEGKDVGTWNSNHKLEDSHNWKGGRRVRENGYVYLRVSSSKEILEHRHVMEQELSRKLSTEEHVHHKDEDKLNNTPVNLQVMSKPEHQSYHAKKRVEEGTHHFLK
jgi:hypothetical protein